jgi:prepilin-type N-terminal cleavage/methylation domain-containing protein/prepilin-type processing-associated H-X9-DG protein
MDILSFAVPAGHRALPSRTTTNRRPACGFTLVELLVVIAIIGILVALLLPAIQAAREASRRSSCSNKIRQLSIAVQNYESARKHLPAACEMPDSVVNPTGNDGISFYIQILPYIEASNLKDLYDENMQPRKQLARVFSSPEATMSCPTDTPVQVTYAQGYTPADPVTKLGTGDTAQDYKGNYGINWGTGYWLQNRTTPNSSPSVWDFTTQTMRPGQPGPFEDVETIGTKQVTKYIKLKQLSDGTSKTLMFMEMIQAPTGGPPDEEIDRRARLWIPASSTFQISTLLVPNSGPCGSGLSIDTKTGCGKDNAFGIDRPAEGLPCVRSSSAPGYTLASRSRHNGGVNVAMCDSSVRFVANDVDVQIWRGHGSRAGQEVGGDL